MSQLETKSMEAKNGHACNYFFNAVILRSQDNHPFIMRKHKVVSSCHAVTQRSGLPCQHVWRLDNRSNWIKMKMSGDYLLFINALDGDTWIFTPMSSHSHKHTPVPSQFCDRVKKTPVLSQSWKYHHPFLRLLCVLLCFYFCVCVLFFHTLLSCDKLSLLSWEICALFLCFHIMRYHKESSFVIAR